MDDYYLFDVVTFTRVRHSNGEPTELVEIEGLRQGGRRTRIVPYARLIDQADMHREFAHGKTREDAMGAAELAHKVMRAAVAFLMNTW